MENKTMYQIGDMVQYRGNFGNGPIEQVTVIGIGSKNDRVVYDMNNGHWAYEYQIVGKVITPTPVAEPEPDRVYTDNAYTKTAHQRVSEKYVHVDTLKVYDKMTRMGFSVVSSTSARSKTKEHSRHITMFQHPTVKIGDSMLRIIVDNSHDGSRSVTIRIGLFRMACANGLVVGSDVVAPYRIRHIGNIDERVEGIDDYIAASMAAIQTMHGTMVNTILPDSQVEELYLAAWLLRFKDAEGYHSYWFKAKRTEDEGNSTWAVFNRIQETLMKGGLRKRSRAIKSAARDVDFNNELCNLISNNINLAA